MKKYLEIMELTSFSILLFIEEAVQQKETSVLYLLGVATAYVHVAYAIDQITKEEALELLDKILIYAACNTD